MPRKRYWKQKEWNEVVSEQWSLPRKPSHYHRDEVERRERNREEHINKTYHCEWRIEEKESHKGKRIRQKLLVWGFHCCLPANLMRPGNLRERFTKRWKSGIGFEFWGREGLRKRFEFWGRDGLRKRLTKEAPVLTRVLDAIFMDFWPHSCL